MPFNNNDDVDFRIRAKVEGEAQIKSLDGAVKGLSSSHKSHEDLLKSMQASWSQNTASLEKLTASITSNSKAFESRSSSVRSTIKSEESSWASLGSTITNAIKNPASAASGAMEMLTSTLGTGAAAAVGYASGIGLIAIGLREVNKLASEQADLAERISNTSARTGLDVESVQAFNNAAKASGISAGVLESMMKGLTTTLTDMEDPGKKARNTLYDLGVSVKDAGGKVRPVRDILLDFADSLESVSDGAEKQEKVRAVLGKIGGEMLPLLNKSLRENIALQEQWNSNYSQEQVNELLKIDSALDKLGLGYETLTKRVKYSIIEMLRLPEVYKYIDQALTSKVGQPTVQRSGRGLIADLSHSAPSDGIFDSVFGKNPTPKPNHEETSAEKSARETRERKAAEAAKRIADIVKSTEQEKKVAYEKTLSVMARLNAEEQRELKSKGVTPEARANIESRFNFERQSEVQNILKKDREELKKYGESLDEAGDKLSTFNAHQFQWKLKETIAAQGKAIEGDRALLDALYGSDREQASSRSSFTTRISALTARPGDEGSAITGAYKERIRLAQELFQLDQQAAASELDVNKQRLDYAKAEGDLQKATQDARFQKEIEIAELQKKQLDSYKEAAGRVFDSLTANGVSGLRQFATGQLKTIERQLFVNLAGETFNSGSGLSKLIGGQTGADGKASFLGRMLTGTPFASKTPGEQYAKRTADATEKLLGAVTGQAVLPGGGTNPLAGMPSSVIGMSQGDLAKFGSDVNGITGGRLASNVTKGNALSQFFGGASSLLGGNVLDTIRGKDYSIELPDGSYTTASAEGRTSGASRAGAAVGAAGALFAGYQGVAAGIREGGGRGAVGAIGSAAATAAALDPEPISKAVLAGVALAAGVVTSIMGDPKAKRQRDIEQYVNSNGATLPDSISRDLDISGSDISYLSNGGIRTSKGAMNIQINVQAMDSKSFMDNAHNIADAMTSVVAAHPFMDQIRAEFAS